LLPVACGAKRSPEIYIGIAFFCLLASAFCLLFYFDLSPLTFHLLETAKNAKSAKKTYPQISPITQIPTTAPRLYGTSFAAMLRKKPTRVRVLLEK